MRPAWLFGPPLPPPMSSYAPPGPGAGAQIGVTTVLSLALLSALGAAAVLLCQRCLPPASSTSAGDSTAALKTRALFTWHAFSGLVHAVFEGAYLYNSFCVYYALPTSFSAAQWDAASAARSPHHGGVHGAHGSAAGGHGFGRGLGGAPPLHARVRLLTPPDVYWLGRADRLYGAHYGGGPAGAVWREYARADRRWAGVDLTVVCLELATVCVGAPLAAYVCALLAREHAGGPRALGRHRVGLRKWFWMSLLAGGELYGGACAARACVPRRAG